MTYTRTVVTRIDHTPCITNKSVEEFLDCDRNMLIGSHSSTLDELISVIDEEHSPVWFRVECDCEIVDSDDSPHGTLIASRSILTFTFEFKDKKSYKLCKIMHPELSLFFNMYAMKPVGSGF